MPSGAANYGGYPGGGTGDGELNYEGNYERDYDYVIDEVDALEAPAPSPDPSRQTVRREKLDKERSKTRDYEAAELEEAKPATEPTTEPEPLVVGQTKPEQPAPISQKRQVIYTATMQVSVYDLEHSLEIVESLPERYGGWMQQRIDNQLVLRIPAEKLSEAMAAVAELGVVDYRLLEALDVTAEYTDLESRIRILAETQKQLKALLAKATSVEQALEIRRALDQVTLELESARAQMRELSKSIAFSTLILNLVQRGPGQLLPSSNDPFPWVDELGVEATDYR